MLWVSSMIWIIISGFIWFTIVLVVVVVVWIRILLRQRRTGIRSILCRIVNGMFAWHAMVGIGIIWVGNWLRINSLGWRWWESVRGRVKLRLIIGIIR